MSAANTHAPSTFAHSRRGRVLVFIPAYQCAQQIGRVLAQVDARAAAVIDEVIVIDNRSQDNTAERAMAALAGLPVKAKLLRNVENYNLGGSQKVAFEYAMANGFDYVVILHGDDQADLADFVPLLESGVHETVDALLGSRFTRGSRLSGYSPLRIAGNLVFNILFSISAGRRINDLGSGLNMYKVSRLSDRFYEKFSDSLTFNYYLVLAQAALNWDIRFAPISWRETDQVSNVRAVRQVLSMIRILQLYLFRRQQFLTGEHRDTPRPGYPSEVVFENEVAGPVRPTTA